MAYSSGPYVAPGRIDITSSPGRPTRDTTHFRTPRTTSPYTRTADAHEIHLNRYREQHPAVSGTPSTPQTARADGDFVNHYRYSNHARGNSDESGFASVSQSSEEEHSNDKVKDEITVSVPLTAEKNAGPKQSLISATQPWIAAPATPAHPNPTFFVTPEKQEDVFELSTRESHVVQQPQPITEQQKKPSWKRRSSLPLLTDDARDLTFGEQSLVLARSASDPAAGYFGLLRVDIPHYRIGRPRYTERGTVYLQSVYTPSSLIPSPTKPSTTTSRIHDSELAFPPPPPMTTTLSLRSPVKLSSGTSLALIDEAPITPDVYNTFLSDSENPNFIISTSSGQLLAATPARLIAQITHDQFLDYKLLSDFFLTFRCFLKPARLLEFLVARLRWAVFEPTHGRIVRVRAFVALRHWILNYFLDDFEPDFQLRTKFCDLINDLAACLRRRADGGAGDLQIIGELKKAWRRTCDIVWEARPHRRSSSQAILPGGRALGRTMKQDFLSAPMNPGSARVQRSNTEKEHPRVSNMTFDAASPRASVHAFRGGVRAASLHVGSRSTSLWRKLFMSRRAIKTASIVSRGQKRRSYVASRSVRLGSLKRPRRALTMKRLKPGSLPSERYLEPFSNGQLIRGIVTGPVVHPGDRRSRPLSISTENFEPSALGHRSASVLSAYSDSDAKSSRHQAWPSTSSKRYRGPNRSMHTVDQLTVNAANHYLDLRSEAQRERDRIVEVPTPPEAASVAPRKTQSAYHRTQSRVTAGSRSIVIVDDTHQPWKQDDKEELENITPWGEGHHDTPQVPDYFAFQNVRIPAIEPAMSQVKTELRKTARRNSTGSIAVTRIDAESSLSTVDAIKQDRASFQDQAAKLAIIDDQTAPADDGGVESTLAKLEGTSTRSVTPPGSSHSSVRLHALSNSSAQPVPKGLNLLIPDASPALDYNVVSDLSPKNSAGGIFSPVSSRSAAMSDPHRVSCETLEASRYWPLGEPVAPEISGPARSSISKSIKASHPSSFLLEPEETLEAVEEQDETAEELPTLKASEPARRQSSLDTPRHNRVTSMTSVAQSFLLDDDESDYEEDTQSRDAKQMAMLAPLTPLSESQRTRQCFGRFAPPMSPPPASPLPMPPANNRTTVWPMPEQQKAQADNLLEKLARGEDQVHPSPLPSAGNVGNHKKANLAGHATHTRNVSESTMLTALTGSQVSRTYCAMSRHTPFILFYSADVLARHFTVIEQDAVTEIHWKELIDTKWNADPVKVHDWATYLTEPAQSGIDMVVARFHLVVKWAISQIVMTSDTTDRARAIAKFIEIADACRRIGNIATCYQLTVAMLSPAIVRLTRTWSVVEASTCQTLADLERLVHSRGDFARLRTEMETRPQTGGKVDAVMRGDDDGMDALRLRGACIPLVSIYMHDLSINQQKPAMFEPLDAVVGEAMINFERFQTSARIVKGVLKLLEASSLYKFRVERELTAKCLWLSALDDEEIARRSIALCFV